MKLFIYQIWSLLFLFLFFLFEIIFENGFFLISFDIYIYIYIYIILYKFCLIHNLEQIFCLRINIHLIFFYNPGCPSQLTHITTNLRIHWTPCKPSKQVRHRGDDRRARWGLNPGCRGKETLSRLLGHKPLCLIST
jgi:hypothetical protein